MLKRRADLFDKNKSEFSPSEEAFKKKVEELFGLHVKETLWEVGAFTQRHILVWGDFSEDTVKNEDLKEPMIKEYLEAFAIDVEEYEIFLSLYDYRDYLESYMYGHAISDMKRSVSEICGVDPCDVMVFYEPRLTILAESNEVREALGLKMDLLIEACYGHMKKYDGRDILKKENIRINILVKSEMDERILNDMYMKP